MPNADSLATRERRTQLLQNVAVFALFAALVGAYLLTFGPPPGFTARPGELPHAAAEEPMVGPAVSTSTGDGVVPEGVTVFDDDHPALGNLNPRLLGALRTAAEHAAAGGVAVVVTSERHSPEHQPQQLHDDAAQYGTGAAQSVATAETSAHVYGGAVDIGSDVAIEWLSLNGGWYGLCQVYANEPWHFEYLPDAVTDGCPAMHPDPIWEPTLNPG